MEKFIAFCRVEIELFNDLISNKGGVRYFAKKELFFSAYSEFTRIFENSGMTWDKFIKNTLYHEN